MRTLLFLAAGFLLLASCAVLGRLFSSNYPASTTWTLGAFAVLWLAIAAFNMWVGVSKAGYSAGEEFPIFLLIFAVPAAVAMILKWKFL